MDRPEPPAQGDERETTLGFLTWLRLTVAGKAEGLTREQMLATHPPSAITLLGMLKHLAYVEDYWCGYVLAGREMPPPWDTAPWDEDPDWDWTSARGDDPEQVLALWRGAVERADAVLTSRSPDDLAERARGDLGHVRTRWVMVHLVEEYARHAGHADLLRESVDGVVGE